MRLTNQTTKTLSVSSETGRLKKVLIHRPDDGIEKVTPSRATDLLYEDIVYLPKMKEEHDVFTKALEVFIGENQLLDVQNLLTDILEIPAVKNELLEITAKLENISASQLREFYPLEADDTAKLLITGSIAKANLFNPLPNLIFTRDIGVVINDHLLPGIASKAARRRESIIMHFIFRHHPVFASFANQNKIIDLSNNFEVLFEDNDFSVEGGDIMIFERNHVVMATSERTTRKALKEIARSLFENNVVEKITVVDLPKDRYCMHLDTVFTRISENECVGFEPLIMQEGKMSATLYSSDGKEEKFPSLKSLLVNLNPWMEFIPCGEGITPFAEREQWTDGCNLVAVKSGVAFTYDRNIKTNQALKDHGFNIISAAELIEASKSKSFKVEEVSRTIITIPSSELSRARGGPHCMTMPIERENGKL